MVFVFKLAEPVCLFLFPCYLATFAKTEFQQVLRRLSQKEHCKFKASQSSLVRLVSAKQNKTSHKTNKKTDHTHTHTLN